MDLTDVQQRTVTDLIGRGRVAPGPEGLVARVRRGLEEGLADLGLHGARPPLRLGKARLNALERCPGAFAAAVAGERAPFELTPRRAAGRLFHKAIEVDMATERRVDPRSVCERAARSLGEDREFARFWAEGDRFDRAELVVEAGRRLVRFRDAFPPLARRWAPQPELAMRASLAEGGVILAGAPDLVLGRGRRLILDLKAFGAWPEYVEDLRFYALLVLLRTGVAPYRVATVFLESATWQAEDVDAPMLDHAAHRVLRAARAAAAPEPGLADLRPGRHCGWCPRSDRCPVSAVEPGAIPALTPFV
jgi:PD-(D/E)XK nuclease superfamily